VRTLALVDGEHYPPVVRAALARAGEEQEVVAALLLGGDEKLRGQPDYGLPLERAGTRPAAEAMLAAAADHRAGRVLDLSDEPVLGQAERVALACRALAGGIEYAGPDFHFRPPPRIAVDVPTVAVIGTGKRVGKTSVSAHLARLLRESGRRVVVVAMGRGGPAEPELVDAGHGTLGVADLLARSQAGQHAASDFLEDAALARVTTVGARRCGGGLFGRPYISNVEEAVRRAAATGPEIIVLEGSGAALPPVAADRTLLVHPATAGPAGAGFDLYRLLLANLVVLTMCDPPFDAAAGVMENTAMIRTVLRPVPAEPVAGARIAYFSTAPDPARPARELAAEYGADVVLVSPNLARRDRLAGDLERAADAGADTYLVEIKAAAIDVVAEAAAARGVRVVFCDNRPLALPGEPNLDAALLDLAGEAVAAGA
jgi:cyclic 2,3-diphosphoglycerate synthetase